MARDLAEDIDTYIGHFRSEHAKLKTLEHDLHRRILGVTMLSALAEGRYPREPESGPQFVKLIEAYCAWPDSTSISVELLAMAESANPRLGAGTMDELAKRAAAWRTRNVRALDPQAVDIMPNNATPDDRKRIDQFKHSALLWVYRNKLVHEYRKPGHGMDWSNDEAPFYHSMTHLGEGKRDTRELVYPATWILGLVPPVLDALERFYLLSETNPYESYKFGSPWRR